MKSLLVKIFEWCIFSLFLICVITTFKSLNKTSSNSNISLVYKPRSIASLENNELKNKVSDDQKVEIKVALTPEEKLTSIQNAYEKICHQNNEFIQQNKRLESKINELQKLIKSNHIVKEDKPIKVNSINNELKLLEDFIARHEKQAQNSQEQQYKMANNIMNQYFGNNSLNNSELPHHYLNYMNLYNRYNSHTPNINSFSYSNILQESLPNNPYFNYRNPSNINFYFPYENNQPIYLNTELNESNSFPMFEHSGYDLSSNLYEINNTFSPVKNLWFEEE
jgi:hypothetical protein